MESSWQLDPARTPEVICRWFNRVSALLPAIILLAVLPSLALQAGLTTQAQQLFSAEKWNELVQLLSPLPNRSPELDYEYGIALANLQRWEEAQATLERGSRNAPRDKRFPTELAGVAFRQKKYAESTRLLHRALHLDGSDQYANDFLATVYFLQGNLEAAVKYWNRAGKPQIHDVRTEPVPHLRPALMDHALAFSPRSVLNLEQLRESEARLKNLEVFSDSRVALLAADNVSFDAVLRAQELNGFGSSRIESFVRVLRGLPFQEVDPEYDNIVGRAMNVSAVVRWDSDKRRFTANISSPLAGDPRWRYTLHAGVRNENWDLRKGFTGPAPVLASLNLRREEIAAEIARLIAWRARWSLKTELSHRDYRNISPALARTSGLATQGFQLKETAAFSYQLLRSPERRLVVRTGVSMQAARLWSSPADSWARLQALLQARWYPQSRGDDYQLIWSLRAGKTFGEIPFDELFMLGLERDSDLWMRGHIGTRDGRKGSAPLGRNYFLSNWEQDKKLYSNGLLTLKLGPFLDTGKITDSDVLLGSEKWLWDTGLQAKLRVLGIGVVFSYGKDLRTGNNAFYTTVTR